MDAQQIGRAFRAVRIQKRLRQEDVATAARVARTIVSEIELGRAGALRLKSLDAVAEALDIRLDVLARWRGGDLDRLLSARHSALHERAAHLFVGLPGWTCEPEVTYSIYGERGSIDLVGWHEDRRALIVIELKTELVDVQALVAQVDRYRRLGPQVVRSRGWRPATTSCWVLVAESATNRRHVAAHQTMLRNAFPSDGRAMSRWLRGPEGSAGSVAGLSFLSYAGNAGPTRNLAAVKRVRRRGRIR